MEQAKTCPICAEAMVCRRREWLWYCTSCRHWSSTLPLRINHPDSQFDDVRLKESLKQLRIQSFEHVLQDVQRFQALPGTTVLDVGCSTGVFLDVCTARQMDAYGIEPDETLAALAAGNGHRIIRGYFPDMLEPGRRFSVIAFNDVFEHITDVDAAIAAAADRVEPDGVLIVNLPSSDGVLFRTAMLLDALGIGGALDRLWQKNFDSPHLEYFNADRVARLCAAHGLAEVSRWHPRTITVRRLWARLRSDPAFSRAACAVIWTGMVLLAPFLRLLPADFTVQLFRHRAAH